MNDHAATAEPRFVYVTYIDTTPDKLWQAITRGDFTARYWAGRRIESDWKVGSPVRHLEASGKLDWQGEVLAADPGKLLSYTFDVSASESECDMETAADADSMKREKPSRVTFEIQEFKGKVKLTVTHDQFEPGSTVLAGVSSGWPAILSGLKTLLESNADLFPDWR